MHHFIPLVGLTKSTMLPFEHTKPNFQHALLDDQTALPQLPPPTAMNSITSPAIMTELYQRARIYEAACNAAVAARARGIEPQIPDLSMYFYGQGHNMLQSAHSHSALHPAFLQSIGLYGIRGADPRGRFPQEEPKPNQSYIGLIAMAILSHPEKKLILSDIYQWILDNYSYFRTRGPGWRNSIRHNLSLNDCFIKAGRSANGKGHYWAIHPANLSDFKKGDFRRRRAQRKVRKHMGLTLDDDDDDSPLSSPVSELNCSPGSEHSPNPLQLNFSSSHKNELESPTIDDDCAEENTEGKNDNQIAKMARSFSCISHDQNNVDAPCTKRKRLFDVESLLA